MINWDLWFAAVLVVCAIVSAVITFFQWQTMRRNTAQTDETLQLMQNEQRAWLAVSDLKTGGELKPGRQNYILKITNTGPTPARIVQYKHAIYLIGGEPYPIDEMVSKFDEKAEIDERVVVIPPGSSTNLFTSPEVPLGQKIIDQLREDTVRIYAIGEVTYLDVFAESHTTKYFYVFHPKNVSGMDEDRFVLTGSHNEMN